MKTQSLAATLILVVLAAAPLALAQTGGKPKKGGKKPAASASASATEAPPAPTPEPDPTPPPAASASASAASGDEASAEGKKELPATPPEGSEVWKEQPGKRYYYVGLRYRGDVIPQFLINAAVDGGGTIYSNALGIELDSRKDDFSTVFALTYQDYNTGDLLFHEKSKDNTPQNWSVVNSSLKAIYASVDLLWSVPIAEHLDFEYGLGAGLGVVFGGLMNNWVYATPNGPLVQPDGTHYAMCPDEATAQSCQKAFHSNADVAKVGGYQESAGLFGPKPIIFPMLNIPQLGLRYNPVKEFAARLGVGFSITGFWFGISADYGIPTEKEASPVKATRRSTSVHGML